MRRFLHCLPLLSLMFSIPILPDVHAEHAPKTTELGRVRSIVRGLTVQPPHQARQKAKRAAKLYNKYFLETGASQRASIALHDSTILYMNQRTDAVLTSPTVTLVKKGEIDEVLQPGTNHRIQTNAAVATAMGTNFDVRFNGKRSVFTVISGTILVKSAHGQVMVHQNQQTTVAPNQSPTPPQTVDANATIGWTISLSSGGWQVLNTPTSFTPTDIAVDSKGNIFATDFSADRVVEFSVSGKQVLAWGSSGSGPGQFNAPWGIAIDSKGSVYVSDQVLATVQKFSASGQYVSQIGTTGAEGSGPGQFLNPDGLAVDSADNLYVADQGNDRIQKFSPSGAPLAQFGGSTGSPSLSEPYGVAVNSAGDIYIADTGNDRIVKLGPDGAVLATWGTKGTTLGQFDQPISVAVDSKGDAFVADQLNGRIEEFAPNGEALTSWGTTGTAPGQFLTPYSVALDKAGTLYVSDSHRIQKLVGAAPPG